jgi:hypothetical protein
MQILAYGKKHKDFSSTELEEALGIPKYILTPELLRSCRIGVLTRVNCRCGTGFIYKVKKNE